MRGRLHHVVLDCPDPRALVRLYCALLNHPITYASADFVVVDASDTTSGLTFELAPDYRGPTWPNAAVPRRMHLDILVDSVADATPRCLVWARQGSWEKTCLLTRHGIHLSRPACRLSRSRTDRHDRAPHRRHAKTFCVSVRDVERLADAPVKHGRTRAGRSPTP